MRIAILALGSRGDVQPFVALAIALQRQGHQVTIAAAADYTDLVTAYAIPFAPVGGAVQTLMNFELVNAMLEGAHNPVTLMGTFLRELNPLVNPIVADCWQVTRDADALIVSTLGLLVGLHLIDKQATEGRPCRLVAVHMHPFYSSTDVAHVNFPNAPQWLPGRGAYHRLTHQLGRHGPWQLLRQPLNRARQEVLKLPSLSPRQLYQHVQRPVATLFAYSAMVAPPPVNLPAHAAVTGYWYLPPPSNWQPSIALREFLAAGSPPVLISFGSILGGRNPNQMTQRFVDALQASGNRGLIYRGWGDLGNIPLPPTVMAIDTVPHFWLLPQVAAVVHHGGAGITAATVRAARPSVVVPVFGDQTFWATRLHALGVAPPAIPRRQLTAPKLAVAIQQAIGDTKIATNLQEMAGALQSEDGVSKAVEWLHDYWTIAHNERIPPCFP